jgi:hypothetical protein
MYTLCAYNDKIVSSSSILLLFLFFFFLMSTYGMDLFLLSESIC